MCVCVSECVVCACCVCVPSETRVYATNVDTFKTHIRNRVDRSILPCRQKERCPLMYVHVAPNIDV